MAHTGSQIVGRCVDPLDVDRGSALVFVVVLVGFVLLDVVLDYPRDSAVCAGFGFWKGFDQVGAFAVDDFR